MGGSLTALAVLFAAVIRVGVTGHRSVDDEADVGRRLVAAVRSARGDAPVHDVEMWSSLAEGADRLAAELVPREAGHLVAVLPLAADDYRTDFTSDGSRDQFDRLLALADRVDVVGPDERGSRESAYERAGRRVIDRCDVLVALWDGAPARGRGGTAQMVDEARRLGREVVVIPVVRTPA